MTTSKNSRSSNSSNNSDTTQPRARRLPDRFSPEGRKLAEAVAKEPAKILPEVLERDPFGARQVTVVPVVDNVSSDQRRNPTLYLEQVMRPYGPTIVRIYKPIELWLRRREEEARLLWPNADGGKAPPPESPDYLLWAKSKAILAEVKTIHYSWAGHPWPDLRQVLPQLLEETGLKLLNPKVSYQPMTDCWEILFQASRPDQQLPQQRLDKLAQGLNEWLRQVGWRWTAKMP